MANEATIRASLQIAKGNLDYRSQPTSFKADITDGAGPSPGLVVATTDGVNVDLSALDNPSLCRVMNLSTSGNLDVGIYDPELARFYPLIELKPSESFVIRLSRYLGEEYGATGTGTAGESTARMRVRGQSSTVDALVEAFNE
jgi:hypothetical protein